MPEHLQAPKNNMLEWCVMSRILSRTFLIVVTSTAFAGPWSITLAGPADIKTITVTGQAPGTNSNAMEQAKQDALRKAVEQACGTFVNAQTQTKNYAAVYDKVMSQAAGYVISYDVVSRQFEGDVTTCTVTAKVSTKSFELDWARFAHTLELEGNPRCVVVVVEDNDVEDGNPVKVDGVVQSTLENFLIGKGVQLMDHSAARDVKNRDIELAALNNDINKLAAMSAALKADVVVAGRAEARQAGSTQLAGRTVYKWSATLNIRAYHTDSAQMLMSNSYAGTITTVHQNAGGDDALKKCADENAAAVLRDIGEAWRKRQQVRRSIQITLENCSRPEFKAFEDAALRIDGVQAVRLRELVNNVCQVEFDWSYDMERLIARIESLRVGNTTYAVTEQTHDRATFKLVK
jgi:hypothetical protein